MPEILEPETKSGQNELSTLREIGRQALITYLKAEGANKRTALENISKLSGEIQAETIHLPEFITFIDSFILCVFTGALSMSKGQAKILEMMLNHKLKLGLPKADNGPISVEAEEEI